MSVAGCFTYRVQRRDDNHSIIDEIQKIISLILSALMCIFIPLTICSCSGSSVSQEESPYPIDINNGELDQVVNDGTEGHSFVIPSEILTSPFDSENAVNRNDASIGIASANIGYVSASAHSSARLKLQVQKDDMTYNYDLPNNDVPISVPINMGNGRYNVRIMLNTTESNYVEILSTSTDVQLDNSFLPFMRPNVFCNYTPESACVQMARELASNATNEGDVMRAIYEWIAGNVTYDNNKATQLANATGYVPNPDDTLITKTGICFDYASLAAAMFRSLGIPCKIITGYVGEKDLYHAWNEIYIDGKWVTAAFTIEPNNWTRIDLTFAAADGNYFAGDGQGYTNRYVY